MRMPASRSNGTSPACTTELFPDPDGPTTATNRRAVSASRSARATSSRPKKSSASASANGRRPLYGFTDDEISAVEGRRTARRRSERRERTDAAADGRQHALGATDGGAPGHDHVGHRLVPSRRVGLGRPGDHCVDRRARGADPIRQARQARARREPAGEELPDHEPPKQRTVRQHEGSRASSIVRAGDAEVGQVRVASRIEQDVGGLDIAVDHAGRVCRQQRSPTSSTSRLTRDVERAAAHERGLRRAAGQQPEHEVGAAGLAPVVVERHDVRVFEPGDELASASNRCTKRLSSARSGRITLIATSRFVPAASPPARDRTRPHR